jgi:Na+/melibiose symporter-like transporter
MPALAGSCVLIGIAPTMFLVNVQLSSLLGLAFFMSFTAGMFSAVASPVIKSVLLNVNEPEVRGVAGALQTITDDLGKALGPFIVAGFISVLGRTNAFNIAVCGWFLCGFMILSLVLCMRRDEERMQERLMMTAGRNDLQEEEEEVQEEGARALHRMEEGGGEQFSSNKRPESPDDSSTPMPHGAFESLDSPHPSQLPGMVERESQGIAPGVHPPTSKDAF